MLKYVIAQCYSEFERRIVRYSVTKQILAIFLEP
jgi:hypothetical protein